MTAAAPTVSGGPIAGPGAGFEFIRWHGRAAPPGLSGRMPDVVAVSIGAPRVFAPAAAAPVPAGTAVFTGALVVAPLGLRAFRASLFRSDIRCRWLPLPVNARCPRVDGVLTP